MNEEKLLLKFNDLELHPDPLRWDELIGLCRQCVRDLAAAREAEQSANRLCDKIAERLAAARRDLAAARAEVTQWQEAFERTCDDIAVVRREKEEMLETLRGMLHEWDKFTRYGSPIAKAANENVRRARALSAQPDPHKEAIERSDERLNCPDEEP